MIATAPCASDGLPIGVRVVAADGDLCLALAEALSAQYGSSPPDTSISIRR